MANYFEIQAIHPWLYSIRDPMKVYCYLLLGEDRALLFDTAFGFGDLPAVVRGITNKPLTVVDSHGHADHACGNTQFDTVYLHPADFETCRDYTGPVWRGKSVNMAKELGIFPDGLEEEAYCAAGTGNLVPLPKDAVFDLGGISARVIEMPGHTRGSVGLFVPEQKALLASDAACKVPLVFLPESAPVAVYRNMLERVRKLPFEEHFVGHDGGALDNKQFDLYLKAAREARLDNSVRVPLPDWEGETYAHVVDGVLGSDNFTALIFSKEKLEEAPE
ncbi:MAG: MBL fold metallo-hydrolase [Treponema sp.]|jgi:glyoxylase-like metal-dependent hydrolase (beta-lactamase superfamily II)|nr:MBL fold metallo-hydrolase [Treponema sp.]